MADEKPMSEMTKMVHPSQPKNVVAVSRAALEVYKKTGWEEAKKDAEVTPEPSSIPATEDDKKK